MRLLQTLKPCRSTSEPPRSQRTVFSLAALSCLVGRALPLSGRNFGQGQLEIFEAALR